MSESDPISDELAGFEARLATLSPRSARHRDRYLFEAGRAVGLAEETATVIPRHIRHWKAACCGAVAATLVIAGMWLMAPARAPQIVRERHILYVQEIPSRHSLTPRAAATWTPPPFQDLRTESFHRVGLRGGVPYLITRRMATALGAEALPADGTTNSAPPPRALPYGALFRDLSGEAESLPGSAVSDVSAVSS